MSAIHNLAIPSRPVLPHWGWWALLGVVLAAQLVGGWIAAIGILGFLLVQRARPLDFFISYLVMVTAASFVDYTTGHLTAQLTLLTMVILFVIYCYALSRREELLAVPRTPLTVPLLAYLGLGLANFVRGLVVGNSARYAGLEILAILALASAFLVSNLPMTGPRVKTAIGWLWAMGLGQTAAGLYAYQVYHRRAGGIYFTPVTGVVAALFLNFALRESNLLKRYAWLLAMIPLLVHQFVSFTRGYWFAFIGSTLFSVFVYAGFRSGARERWVRVAATLGPLVALGIVGAVAFALVFGIAGLGELAATRFSSTTTTEFSYAGASNVTRLVEYMVVIQNILQAPWLGHGLGFYFVVREPLNWKLQQQWYSHQNYLLVWLKQGLLGLAIFVTVLIAAVKTGLRGRNLPESWRSAWCAGAAAVAVHMIIYCNVHFPMAEINTVFTVALIWGVAMSIVSEGQTVLHFGQRRPE